MYLRTIKIERDAVYPQNAIVTPFNYWIRTILFRPSSILLHILEEYKNNSKDSFFLSFFFKFMDIVILFVPHYYSFTFFYIKFYAISIFITRRN